MSKSAGRSDFRRIKLRGLPLSAEGAGALLMSVGGEGRSDGSGLACCKWWEIGMNRRDNGYLRDLLYLLVNWLL